MLLPRLAEVHRQKKPAKTKFAPTALLIYTLYLHDLPILSTDVYLSTG